MARKIESVSEVAESIQHLRVDFMKRLEEICKKVGVSDDYSCVGSAPAVFPAHH